MRDRDWLDAVRRELETQCLPARYVERLIEELSDRLHDCQENVMGKDACDVAETVDRMGAPANVASAARDAHRTRTFCGRHPVLVFVVLPVLTILLGWTGAIAGIVGVGSLIRSYGLTALTNEQLSPTGVGAHRLVCTLLALAPAILGAAIFSRIAARAGLGRLWPLIACAILGIFAGVAKFNFYLSSIPHRSSFNIGMGFGSQTALVQLAQLAVPLLIGAWLLRTRRRNAEAPNGAPWQESRA